MTIQLQHAFISPRDGFAGILDDDGLVVSMIAPPEHYGSRMLASSYACRFPDTTIAAVSSPEEAIKVLAENREYSLALDYAILVFDSGITSDLREQIADELDGMLLDETKRDYILDILLAKPLPNTSDIEGAIAATKKFARVQSLVNAVVSCQDRVRSVFNTWLQMHDHTMVKQMGANRFLGLLMSSGVLRRLIQEVVSQCELQAAKVSLLYSMQQHPMLLNTFLSIYSESLPVGVRVAKTPSSIEEQCSLHDTREGTILFEQPRKVFADVERWRAESQVEKISNLYRKGDDSTADQFLEELITSQTHEINNYSHVVKSLCNIATKCTVYGRSEISLRCLQRALGFTTGIDSVLFLQVGTALRELDQYDQAISCYQKALELDKGERRETIQHGIIRTHVAKGDYAKALEMYHEIWNIENQPSMLFGLGTLYRRIGNFRSARESFVQVLSLDGSYHAAYAGLAETLKQNGDHHKALGRYESILIRFNEMDEGSKKVYSLAKSHLLQLTKQFNNADNLLRGLLADYPMDSNVHFQLAKLYMLKGQPNLAKVHFDHAQGPSLSKAAADLYLTAAGKETMPTISALKTRLDQGLILPEDAGLVSCNKALLAIEQNNFELASQLVQNTRYTDRLQKDFGTVLSYHAAKAMLPTYNYKSNRSICLVAKRGIKELRQAVQSITDGQFGSAIQYEQRMCLLIA